MKIWKTKLMNRKQCLTEYHAVKDILSMIKNHALKMYGRVKV
jgi:hypothetical protein